MTDSERLKTLIDYLKVNPNQFSKFIGLKRSTRIYQILNGRNGISVSLANIIIKKYNIFNYEWILNGKGEMIQLGIASEPEMEYSEAKHYSEKRNSEEIRELKARLFDAQETIKELKETIKRLKSDKLKQKGKTI